MNLISSHEISTYNDLGNISTHTVLKYWRRAYWSDYEIQCSHNGRVSRLAGRQLEHTQLIGHNPIIL